MLKSKEALENIVAQNPPETRLNIYQQTMDKRCLEDPEIENYSEAIPSFISLRSHIDRHTPYEISAPYASIDFGY
ncbi:unnamed protein product [Gordionus sp. m RMFG-2023]